MRMWWVSAVASAIGLTVTYGNASATGLKLFQRSRHAPAACIQSSTYPTPGQYAPAPAEEMVTITQQVQVIVYQQVAKQVQVSVTDYVRQPDGSLIPVQRMETRTVTDYVPVMQTQTVTKQVPASSTEALRFELQKLKNDVNKRPDKDNIQQQIDDILNRIPPAPKP